MNREIKFRIWFDEPGAPPQMIYPHIDDFIKDKNENAVGRAFLDCDYQKGLKVYYQIVMNPANCKKETLGLLDNTQYEAANSALMEYVGIKDKNGVGLHEGDVVVFDNSTLNYLVEYSNGRFHGAWKSKWNPAENEMITCQSGNTNWFNWRILYFDEHESMERFSNFTILGNKYENPELLVDDQIEEVGF